jgi:hypothetical protein
LKTVQVNAALLKQHENVAPPFSDKSFAGERAAWPLFWQGKPANKARSLFLKTELAFWAAAKHGAALFRHACAG